MVMLSALEPLEQPPQERLQLLETHNQKNWEHLKLPEPPQEILGHPKRILKPCRGTLYPLLKTPITTAHC